MPHPSSAAVIDLYERHASQWVEERGKLLNEKKWLDRFLEGLPEGGTILDLGCGPGDPIGVYMASLGFRITGVDSSPAMIALASQRLPQHRWITNDMRSLDLQESFDGMLAWDSFFHLSPEDQKAMFPMFNAHAHQGTALMFTSGPDHGEAIGTYRGEELYHASLSPDEYGRVLGHSGFMIVAFEMDDQTCGGHTVWLSRQVLQL